MSFGTRVGGDVARTPSDLSEDEVFDLLANARRRGVLHYLRRVEGAADLSDMAARIASWEYGTPVEELDPAQRKRVYTSLQQTHLRKLEDAGVVEYDDEAAVVHPTDAADDLEVYLEVVPGGAFPWRELYLALGAVSSALVIVAWANVGPFAHLPAIVVAALVAGAVTVSAVAHVRHARTMRLGGDERPPGAAPEDGP